MTVFRYRTKHIGEDEIYEAKGFVCAKNYTKAMEKLEKYSTAPDGSCDLISVEELYEIENSNGIIDDFEIKMFFEN